MTHLGKSEFVAEYRKNDVSILGRRYMYFVVSIDFVDSERNLKANLNDLNSPKGSIGFKSDQPKKTHKSLICL